MDTKIDGDKAAVKVVDGTLTYTDENGDKTARKPPQATPTSWSWSRWTGNGTYPPIS